MDTATMAGPAVKVGVTVPFDAICDAGAYVCDWSGHLLRVPEEVAQSRRSLPINIVGREPLTVTKISDNPHIPLHGAQEAARSLDVAVNF